MGYELFRRSAARTEETAIAIAPHGRIALNAACTRLFETAGISAVKILWDKERCGIALKATNKGDEDSYSVAFSAGRSASITTRSFFKYIGWSATKRQTVPARWDDVLRILKAELPPQFVASCSGPSPTDNGIKKVRQGARFRSPGASGNIRNWLALNESVPKK